MTNEPAAQNQPDRRHFLQTAAVTSLAATAAATGIVAGTRPAAAIDPFARNGNAKFKFSLAAYSYRSLLQGDNATLTLKDFINDCADFGLEGTELTSYYFPEPVTDDYLLSLRAQCFRLGLTVSGTAVGNNFGLPVGDERSKQITGVKKWIEHAAVLGAPVIRIFAGQQHKTTTAQESHRLMVQGIEECCQYAGERGIFLALENHGGPTATAEGLLNFVHDVKSPWFGVNLDSGNFHSENPYEELKQIAPYSLNVQVKVVTSGPDKSVKPMDFARLRDILRDSGYRGFIVLEYEEDKDPRTASRDYLLKLREAFLS